MNADGKKGDGGGDQRGSVDLWRLRELAVGRGGLLSPSLRKRAWPKLLGIDDHILRASTMAVPKLMSRPAAAQASPFPDTVSTEASALSVDDPSLSLPGVVMFSGSAHRGKVVEVSEEDLDIMRRDVGRSVSRQCRRWRFEDLRPTGSRPPPPSMSTS